MRKWGKETAISIFTDFPGCRTDGERKEARSFRKLLSWSRHEVTADMVE